MIKSVHNLEEDDENCQGSDQPSERFQGPSEHSPICDLLFEEYVCTDFVLKPAPISTQIIPGGSSAEEY